MNDIFTVLHMPENTVYDLKYRIYGSGDKIIHLSAEKENCKIINGMGMLLYQGALAFEMWTSKEMPVDYIKNIIFN